MKKSTLLLIIVASLGYFVDIYDLVLFNVVKKESLEQIMAGASAEEMKNTGIFLFNMQMIGMLIGGLLWGIWGDKKGRVSVLFGSILLYSLANMINAFTFSIPLYAVIRVIAGIGLAGELGAGITLVSESMEKTKRGYGTMIIVTFGALGAVVAALIGDKGAVIGSWLEQVFGQPVANWQVAYLVGGTLGLLLLLLRVGTIESGMFKEMHASAISKGDFFMLFRNRQRFLKYLYCILIGIPIWYMIGLLASNSQEIFAPALQIQGAVKNGTAVMFTYMGLSAGDLLSGLISQFWRSRKKVLYLYLSFSSALVLYFLFGAQGISADAYYFLCFALGCGTGYWAIFVTNASEQFGTNIRSTVTNTVPNFVRGSVPLITTLFASLLPLSGNIWSAFWVGLLCLGLAIFATFKIEDTFHKDLNYNEQG